MIWHFLALEFWHRHRVCLRWRWLATAQQLTRIFAFRAAKILAKATGLELHLRATFIAVQYRTVLALNFELAPFNQVAIAIRIVAANVQLTLLIK